MGSYIWPVLCLKAVEKHHAQNGEYVGGDVTQDFRFQDIDVSINHIGSYLVPTWLLDKAFDNAPAICLHYSINSRIVRRGQSQAGCGFILAVQLYHRAQVNVCENIFVKNNEGIVQEPFAIFTVPAVPMGKSSVE